MGTPDDYGSDAWESRWDYDEAGESEDETVNCPECGSPDIYDKIRQYAERHGIVDVGWECDNCGWQWGFEMSAPSRRENKP